MGKKKKKIFKPFCYYCDREFDDEKILIQHQKAKHFKCHVCHKKLSTASGMIVHVLQVHKETVSKVPNAKPGKDSTELEIFGMEGVPYEAMEAHDGVDEPQQAKTPKVEIPTFQPATFNPVLPSSIGMPPQTLYAPTPPVLPRPPQPIQPQRPPHPAAAASPSVSHGVFWPPQPPPPQQFWPPRPPSMPPPRALPPQPLFPIQPRPPSGPPPPPLFPIGGPQAPPRPPPQPLFPIANSQSTVTPTPPSNPPPPPSQPSNHTDLVGVNSSTTSTQSGQPSIQSGQLPYSLTVAAGPPSGHTYASGPSTGGPSIGPPPTIANKPPSQAPAPSAPEVYLVWDDEIMSMEERRLSLPRYRSGIQAPSGTSLEAGRGAQGQWLG